MRILDWLPWRRQKRMLTLEQWMSLGLIEAPTAAGVTVSESNALTLSAYWAGVNLIATAVGKLPRKVYQKRADGSREELPNHAIARIVDVAPNELSTAINFWRTFMGHVLTWGNGYAEIEWDRAGRPVGLLTIMPDRIEPVIENGSLWYVYAGQLRLSPEDVFHVPGLGFDGLRGYSVVQMAKQSLGLGLAAERYGAAFFGNGAMPGIVLEHPRTLSEAAVKRLRESWNSMHQGPDRAHRLAILEEGLKATPLSIPAKDAQLIETREVQVLEVARWLNINPAMLGYKTAERPGGNYESNRLDYLDNTLDPWLVAIEQESNRKLVSRAQQGTVYVEHVRNAVLRTDARTRADVQKIYVDMGVMDPEYVAKIENLPKPKPKAEPPPAPSPAPVPPPPESPEPPEDPEPPEPDPERSRKVFRRLIADRVHGLTKLEAERARRAAAQGPAGFEAWAESFYAQHEIRVREALGPVVRGWTELGGNADSDALLTRVAAELVLRNREELLEARSTALEADVETRVSRWERERPGEIADMVLEA